MSKSTPNSKTLNVLQAGWEQSSLVHTQRSMGKVIPRLLRSFRLLLRACLKTVQLLRLLPNWPLFHNGQFDRLVCCQVTKLQHLVAKHNFPSAKFMPVHACQSRRAFCVILLLQGISSDALLVGGVPVVAPSHHPRNPPSRFGFTCALLGSAPALDLINGGTECALHPLP